MEIRFLPDRDGLLNYKHIGLHCQNVPVDLSVIVAHRVLSQFLIFTLIIFQSMELNMINIQMKITSAFTFFIILPEQRIGIKTGINCNSTLTYCTAL